MRAVSPSEMAIFDENCEYLGVCRLILMENAGRAVAAEAANLLGGSVEGRQVVVFSGIGNNGGDGFVAARHLAGMGAKVRVILLGRAKDIRTDEARVNWKILENMRMSVKLSQVRSVDELLAMRDEIVRADLVIDAIFGTGLHGKIREPYATAIDLINEVKGPKIAVDLPSGLDPETGLVHHKAVRADLTVSMHAAKPGLLVADAEKYVGRLVVAGIGMPPEAELVVGPGDVRAVVRRRKPYARKGEHGRVLVVGGCDEYSGAPALTALASLRMGADLAIVAAPESVADAIRSYSPNLIVRRLEGRRLSRRNLPKLRELLQYCHSVAIGPGLGLAEETASAVSEFLAIAVGEKPVVVDADAIKALAKRPVKLSRGKVVITPHAGEFKILTGIELAPPEKLRERIGQVSASAEKLGAVLLLKSHEDIISDGKRYKVNWTGNPGMTVGGTGDVLTGIVATLLAWGVEPFRAGCAAAYVNGAAGDLAVKELGYHITATDVLEKIPEVMREFEEPTLGLLKTG
ncbi:bifunctional ADP-dependent NAD(P)H-hydrate dehydratase/NAD(P)H-hydrate epimerase [Candidatus Bathyarchaeota archaeon]|nr:MAG: bifunctional ADP-dependent NAD(P)H-hydrate dehydratase/NAD(P)H-hydrate epimerase [Candidatus Bathyarchaeota archaeon]